MPRFTKQNITETGTPLTARRGPKKGWQGRTKNMQAANPAQVRTSRVGNIPCAVVTLDYLQFLNQRAGLI